MNWKILYKYVQGECTGKELKELGDWLQEGSANEDFFTSFIEDWEEKKEVRFHKDDQTAWRELKEKHIIPGTGQEIRPGISKLLSIPARRTAVKNKKRKRKAAYWSYVIATAAVLLFSVLFVVYQQAIMQSEELEIAVQYQEINTVKGQRSNLKLSDGSVVFLNSSTTLKIPQDYGRETRTLYLNGEAFFEVTHDEANPFIVISDGVYTKDLGTQFNISAYDSGRVEVAVKEGLVSIGRMEDGVPQKEIVEITPNKVGILHDIGGLTVADIENMDKYVGWMEGKLVFQETPFPEVAKRLERWYDIEFEIESVSEDVLERTLTATYDNMPMSEVLQVMAVSLKLSYERDGRTFLFRDLDLDDVLNGV